MSSQFTQKELEAFRKMQRYFHREYLHAWRDKQRVRKYYPRLGNRKDKDARKEEAERTEDTQQGRTPSLV